jgi:acyl-CoA synthetase (NDP forming)
MIDVIAPMIGVLGAPIDTGMDKPNPELSAGPIEVVVFSPEPVTIYSSAEKRTKEHMKQIFYPQSIVVIGVSERADNLGSNIIANLKTFQYPGELYAVGRESGEVYGVPVSASLDQVPDHLDLAVIITPAALVPHFTEICGRKGIRRVVVESGGFSEFSQEGKRLEQELLATVHKWNMRLVGPNCISVVNLRAGVCLPFAPLSPAFALPGCAAVIAQSGGVSLTYMGMLSSVGVGASKVVSIGNKADLDETDYIEYLLADEESELICLYLESISDGRRLMELASSSSKPLIIHKANRTKASHSVAFSHTAALADDDRIVSAAFKQAGILRAEGFRDLVAIAQGLTLPPVLGDDLVIISRSGGHAVAAADAAERHGFRLTPLPESFTNAVRSYFRADVIALTNPIDLGVIFDFDIYAQIVEQCLHALSPSAILLINTYSVQEDTGALQLARRVGEIVQKENRPIAFCVYADTADPQMLQREIGIPVYDDIETALRGLASSRIWHAWRRQKSGIDLSYSLDSTHASQANSGVTHALPLDQALVLCQQYGIHTAPWAVADDPSSAVRAAQEIGFPLALKLISDKATHKSDVGGVVLGVSDVASLRREVRAMTRRLKESELNHQEFRFLLQSMIPGNIELVVGGKRDHAFGPVVMFGLGGIYVEVFQDVAFRVVPLSREQAEGMIDEVRASQLLKGIRGQRPVDREEIIQTLLAISRLMLENPHIVEIDINPLMASAEGVVAVDARVMILG